MTAEFDPYRKWLGIPAGDQPPHHYRLLGIEPFESDPEVIGNAADARMALVKTFQTGKHSEHSQRLLNELAAAKVCLLNPAKKAEYDRGLVESGEWRVEGRVGAGTGGWGENWGATAGLSSSVERNFPDFTAGQASSGTRSEEPEVIPPVIVSGRPSSYLASRRSSRQPSWLAPAIVFGVAILAAVVLAIVLQDRGVAPIFPKQGEVAPNKPPPSRPKSPAAPTKSKPVVPVPEPAPTGPVSPPPAPKEPEQSQPAPEPPEIPPAKESPKEQPEAEEPELPAMPKAPAPKAEPERRKLPIPDAAAQRNVETEIRKLFAEDFAAADNARKKMALVDKLRRQAGRVNGDPTARFVLFRMSAELLSGTGELSRGFSTVERLAERYDASPLVLKIELSEAVAPGYRPGGKSKITTADLWVNAATLLELADEAERADDYATALRAAKLAVSLARMTKEADFIRETAAELRELEHRKSRFRPVEEALGRLAERPDDAESCLTVGRWRCFTLGDWERGLPLLAEGSDAALAALARRDLAEPASGADRLALAEDWLAAADKEQPAAKPGPQSRAIYWFERALPLLDGLEQTKVQKRIDELQKKGARPKTIRGIVAKGNVARENKGASVVGATRGKQLIDGKFGDGDSPNYAYEPWPCQWTIALGRSYRLSEIRFRIYDFDQRVSRYVLSVSADGERYAVVKDAGQEGGSGWQRIRFPPRPVKTIKLEGLHNNTTKYFSVIELEAYCIPPQGK